MQEGCKDVARRLQGHCKEVVGRLQGSCGEAEERPHEGDKKALGPVAKGKGQGQGQQHG